MLTTQHIEEGLSHAYLSAIVVRAGMGIGKPSIDYGVDGTISRIMVAEDGRRVESGIKFDYQLKATSRWRYDGGEVVYPLEVKTYNDIVQRLAVSRTVPLLLILMCLPQQPAEWLENDEEKLTIRKCCYWYSIQGSITNNTATVTIRVPRNQLLTPESLTRLLDDVSRGNV